MTDDHTDPSDDRHRGESAADATRSPDRPDAGAAANRPDAKTGRERTRRSLLAAAASATAVGAAGCATITTPADVANRVELSGNVGYFVGPGTVARRLDEFVPLDARTRDRYRDERVYGARLAPFEALTARRETDAGLVPDAEELADALSGIGVVPDDDVVVYGSSVGSRVTRVAFALEYLGHRGDVLVMNGGFTSWNGRVGTGRREPDPTAYDPDPVPETTVTRDWLAERLGSFNADGGPGLVDVRHPDAYLAAAGSDELEPTNERQGHLPGAVDVHWVGNVAGRTLADPGGLFDLYGNRAGVPEDRPIVVYGQENVDPTNTWVVLRALGFTDVRLYDGGFAEWANVPEQRRGDYPLETKTHTVVETEGDVGGDDDGGFSCTG